jgi:hypothetical protein
MFETVLAGLCFLGIYTIVHERILHQMLDTSKAQHLEKKSHAS